MEVADAGRFPLSKRGSTVQSHEQQLTNRTKVAGVEAAPRQSLLFGTGTNALIDAVLPSNESNTQNALTRKP